MEEKKDNNNGRLQLSAKENLDWGQFQSSVKKILNHLAPQIQEISHALSNGNVPIIPNGKTGLTGLFCNIGM